MRVTKIARPVAVMNAALGYTPPPPLPDEEDGYDGLVTVLIPREVDAVIVFEPAPSVVDDDEGTYAETSEHDEAMRVALEEPVRFSEFAVLIAVETGGARTYSLYGALMPDFSDEQLLAVEAFEATGTWTVDRVEFDYATSFGHQYYRLIGNDEVRRWHELYLTEAAFFVSFPGDDTHVWMPLTTIVDGAPELVWDENLSLIPTLVPRS